MKSSLTTRNVRYDQYGHAGLEGMGGPGGRAALIRVLPGV